MMVRERTPAAALQAAQRLWPQIREAILRMGRRGRSEMSEADLAPQASQIVPTRLELTVVYIPGASHTRCITWTSSQGRNWNATWE